MAGSAKTFRYFRKSFFSSNCLIYAWKLFNPFFRHLFHKVEANKRKKKVSRRNEGKKKFISYSPFDVSFFCVYTTEARKNDCEHIYNTHKKKRNTRKSLLHCFDIVMWYISRQFSSNKERKKFNKTIFFYEWKQSQIKFYLCFMPCRRIVYSCENDMS